MPSVRVVIPTLNEAKHIGRVLSEILEAAAPFDADVVVADGGSTDATVQIVTAIQAREPRVSLLRNSARRQAAGVNLAARSAPADCHTLVRVDAHCRYPRDFLRQLLTEFDTAVSYGGVAAGVCMRSVGIGPWQRAAAKAQNHPLGNGRSPHRSGRGGRFVTHAHNAAFLRTAFDAVGGYDETLSHNEDADLDARLQGSGGRIYLSSVEIEYFPRSRPADLWRQYWNFGSGRATSCLKGTTRLRTRQVIPLFALLANAASLAAAPTLPLALVVPVSYMLSLGLVAGIEAMRNRSPSLFLVGPCLAIQHTAWSSGFLRYISSHPAAAATRILRREGR